MLKITQTLKAKRCVLGLCFKVIRKLFCVVFVCWFYINYGFSQNIGINTDGSLPEAGTMLDIKGINSLTTSATQTILQIKSLDGDATALKMQFSLNTNPTGGSRYSLMQSIEGTSTPRALSINPSGGNVGIGILEPEHRLSVYGGNAMVFNVASQSNIILRRANGSFSSPSNLLANDVIGSVNFQSFQSGTTYVNSARVVAADDENHSSTALGSRLEFRTTPNGSSSAASERMRITNQGRVGIGITNPNTLLEVSDNNAIKIGTAQLSSGGNFMHLASNAWYNGSAWQHPIASQAGALLQFSGDVTTFWTHNGAGTFTKRVSIPSSGGLTVGASDEFSVNSSGNITKIRNVNTSWPTANAAGPLINDGSGNLTWGGNYNGAVYGWGNIKFIHNADYTVGANDFIIVMNPSTDHRTITLPTASAAQEGRLIIVKNMDGTYNALLAGGSRFPTLNFVISGSTRYFACVNVPNPPGPGAYRWVWW